MNEHAHLINNGAVLRFRPPHGFYLLHQGLRTNVDQKTAEDAVRRGEFKPQDGKPDQHGVWHFTRARK